MFYNCSSLQSVTPGHRRSDERLPDVLRLRRPPVTLDTGAVTDAYQMFTAVHRSNRSLDTGAVVDAYQMFSLFIAPIGRLDTGAVVDAFQMFTTSVHRSNRSSLDTGAVTSTSQMF